jgi:hypothetical protein
LLGQDLANALRAQVKPRADGCQRFTFGAQHFDLPDSIMPDFGRISLNECEPAARKDF